MLKTKTMSLTTDPKDPRLGHGVDKEQVKQHEAYLVLSDEEIAKGFLRPVRTTYTHVGPPGPEFPLVDLSEAQKHRFAGCGYVKFEPYPEGHHGSAQGRYWTQERLDRANKGCGQETSMNEKIAETYAREPRFYGSTYCIQCQKHLPVDEFVWAGTYQRVGS